MLQYADRFDEMTIARFERWMMAVGMLEHPNIVRAHDAREVNDVLFLAMEYVRGMDLAKVVKRCGRLPIAEACEVIRQAALGLEHIRENGLIHHDIKPSNLMLTESGLVKLLDLGLTRLVVTRASDEGTNSNRAIGTLDYMAPEQASDTHRVDIRADVAAVQMCCVYGRCCVNVVHCKRRMKQGLAAASHKPLLRNTLEKQAGRESNPQPTD